jgi:nucleotide-binding universal stress UspA family protein
MPIKRILLATDGSKESDHALRWAELIAVRFGASVTAVTVLETLNRDALKLPANLKGDISAVDSQILNSEQSRLDRIGAALKEKGIQAEIRISQGTPHEEIVKTARDRRVDLVAMGKRGLTPWGKMLLGSTTSAVLREAPVPVLTVRRGTGKVAVKKILFPTAFPPTADVVLTWAAELAEKFGAVLYVLHVIEAHKSYGKVKGGFIGKLKDSAARQLHSLVESIPSDKRSAITVLETVAVSSRAWSAIIDFAREQGIDMIVMGTNARIGVPRFFLGSVAENVAQESPCPVITVRP